MCRAFQPYTMQGIYFSLKTSFQIKISPFHLSLLQSHHILRDFSCSIILLRNLKKLYSTITLTIFFLFHQEREEILFFRFEEPVFLLSRGWYSP